MFSQTYYRASGSLTSFSYISHMQKYWLFCHIQPRFMLHSHFMMWVLLMPSNLKWFDLKAWAYLLHWFEATTCHGVSLYLSSFCHVLVSCFSSWFVFHLSCFWHLSWFDNPLPFLSSLILLCQTFFCINSCLYLIF